MGEQSVRVLKIKERRLRGLEHGRKEQKDRNKCKLYYRGHPMR